MQIDQRETSSPHARPTPPARPPDAQPPAPPPRRRGGRRRAPSGRAPRRPRRRPPTRPLLDTRAPRAPQIAAARVSARSGDAGPVDGKARERRDERRPVVAAEARRRRRAPPRRPPSPCAIFLGKTQLAHLSEQTASRPCRSASGDDRPAGTRARRRASRAPTARFQIIRRHPDVSAPPRAPSASGRTPRRPRPSPLSRPARPRKGRRGASSSFL